MYETFCKICEEEEEDERTEKETTIPGAAEMEPQTLEKLSPLKVVKSNKMCSDTPEAVEMELQIQEEKKKLEVVKRNKVKLKSL